MAFDPAQIPKALLDAYKAGRCGVYVGSGASKPAGLPMWTGMLKAMLQKALDDHLISKETADEYEKLLLNPSKNLMVASGLKEVLGTHFDGLIRSLFIEPKPAPTPLHHALVQLDKLQFVLTTNYDALIERAYQKVNPDVSICSFRDVGETQRALSNREFFILKAHGDASKPGNGIVMTDSDYRALLYRERAYQSMLTTMFTMYTIVIIGASMTDPELLLLLGYIADAYLPTASPRHYALMADEDIGSVERLRWRKDFNVQVIGVSKANDYAEVTEFLEALCKAAV